MGHRRRLFCASSQQGEDHGIRVAGVMRPYPLRVAIHKSSPTNSEVVAYEVGAQRFERNLSRQVKQGIGFPSANPSQALPPLPISPPSPYFLLSLAVIANVPQSLLTVLQQKPSPKRSRSPNRACWCQLRRQAGAILSPFRPTILIELQHGWSGGCRGGAGALGVFGLGSNSSGLVSRGGRNGATRPGR